MKLSGEQLESLYTTMVKIRRFDEKTTELFQAGLVKGTAHSYVGEEAVAAGACANLREGDYIVGTHRGHGHCIAKGARVDRMMAELMGRQDGYCRGLGGSMHIAALDLNILGCNGIVAAGLPIGTGAGLAAKLRGTEDRKSTRLNSSHRCISYAVFCLKKKNNRRHDKPLHRRDRARHASNQ